MGEFIALINMAIAKKLNIVTKVIAINNYPKD